MRAYIFRPITFALIVGGGAVILTDLYVSGVDIGDAWSAHAPGQDHAKFETWWGGVQTFEGALSAVVAASSPYRDDGVETAVAITALTSWPFAISMHGAWGQHPGGSGRALSWAIPVAVIDAVPLAFDASMLARRERPGPLYAGFEIAASVPQVLFATGVAVNAQQEDRAWAIGATALPTLMMAHGIYALAGGEKRVSSRRRAIEVAPLAGPNTDTRGVSVYGRF